MRDRAPDAAVRLTPPLLMWMSVASGIAVANIYYNQPMLADMARTFHASSHAIGFVASFTQLGYAAGMPLFIPLGDVVERRRLVVALFLASGAALCGCALAGSVPVLVAASFVVGLTTVIAQILIPLASSLAAPDRQGKTVGSILSGVLLGILLARTLSGFVAGHFGWRVMFWIAAAMALAGGIAMRATLPCLPAGRARYRDVLRAVVKVVRETPKLRHVSVVAGLLFAAFGVFWTTLVFRLEAPPYHYGSEAAGLFGLVGAVGAAVAPLAGRMADRKTPRFVVANAIGVVVLAFAAFWAFGSSLWGLVAGVILLDAGIQAAQVANQTRVLALRPEWRNPVNTFYMICYFSGGSAGSLLGSYAWGRWQWTGVCAVGLALPIIAAIRLILSRPIPEET
jgi:predicted MFS family arabinose efflux permease